MNENEKLSQEGLDKINELGSKAGDIAGKGAKKAGRAIGKGLKKAGSAAGKKAAQAVVKALQAIGQALISLLGMLGPIALIILGIALFFVMVWNFLDDSRGAGEHRNQDPSIENPVEYNSEYGVYKATALNKPQALIDAYYKYMSCNSYVKLVDGELFTFSENTEDFAGLADFHQKENNFYLSSDFILMADETLHDKNAYYPEQIIKPVSHDINEDGQVYAVPIVDEDGKFLPESTKYDSNGLPTDEKEPGVWDYGFGSVVNYEKMQKDEYIVCEFEYFTIDIDVWIPPENPNGVGRWVHSSTEKIYLAGKTYDEVIAEVNAHDGDETRVAAPSNSMIRFFLGESISDSYGAASTNRISLVVKPNDYELAARDFNDPTLAKFSNVKNGVPASLYPLNVPVLTSAATMSGSITYLYDNYTSSEPLQEGTSNSFRDPVNTLNVGSGCGSRELIAVRNGEVYTSVPFLELEESEPWGFEYLDNYTEHYETYIPTTALTDMDFSSRVDDDMISFLKELGLLKLYSGNTFGGGGENYSVTDLDILSKLISAEAGLNKLDQLMVGATFMNRVSSSLFPNTMMEVLQQPGQYACWSNGHWAAAVPTQSQIDSAKQVLSGEFSIPANIVFQTADPDGDGSASNNNAANYYFNVCLINNNGQGFYTHYYGCPKNESFSLTDRLGNTTSSSSDSMMAQAERLKNSIPASNPDEATPVVPRPDDAPADEDTLLYDARNFDVLTATNLMQKIVEEDQGLWDSLASWFTSAIDGVQSFIAGIGEVFSSPTKDDPCYAYKAHVNPIDIRGIVYQTIAFNMGITYTAAEDLVGEADIAQFLFVGKNGPNGMLLGSYQMIPGIESVLNGFTSPTAEVGTVITGWTERSGGTVLKTLPNEVVLALANGGTVTSVNKRSSYGQSVTIEWTASENNQTYKYIATYGYLSQIDVTVGTMVNKGDQIGLAGTHEGEDTLFFSFMIDGASVDPMTYFYQPVLKWVSGSDLVEIAFSQLGNVGGAPYRRWYYGYDQGAEWCAIFVSWCADQAGILGTTLPKEASCGSYVTWLKARGMFQPASYTPKPGDIIFFDFKGTGAPVHVGIVERVENGRIYTIEGNTGDGSSYYTRRCMQRDRTHANIYGYGVYS